MFTGIVEAMGTVAECRDAEGARVLRFEVPRVLLEGLAPGGSVAVDGACLTAIEIFPDGFTVEAIGTTLSRTVAGRYAPGSRVNLERAMRLGERLDGHLVQGHVDGLGELLDVQSRGEYRLMDFRIPPLVDEVTILHGSITINGVSLTVNALPAPGTCQVALIPHTWEVTNLGRRAPGDPVNLEGDLIGKYVGRILEARGGFPPGSARAPGAPVPPSGSAPHTGGREPAS